jgi:hypothetical protein
MAWKESSVMKEVSWLRERLESPSKRSSKEFITFEEWSALVDDLRTFAVPGGQTRPSDSPAKIH